MDRFLKRENIKRYRRLASEFTSDAERVRILKLLAEEEARFKLELSAAFAVVPVPDSLEPR
jgi:hypothetical protein